MACVSCLADKSSDKNSDKSTVVVSNDGKTKLDIVVTWVNKDGSTDTIIFNSDGTFTKREDFDYRGKRQLSIGPDGDFTESMYTKASGTYKIVDGNILQRTYTSWWSNAGRKNPGTINRELRVLSPDQFLISDYTYTRKK